MGVSVTQPEGDIKMPQTSLTEYVRALDRAGLLTRYMEQKRVDEQIKLDAA